MSGDDSPDNTTRKLTVINPSDKWKPVSKKTIMIGALVAILVCLAASAERAESHPISVARCEPTSSSCIRYVRKHQAMHLSRRCVIPIGSATVKGVRMDEAQRRNTTRALRLSTRMMVPLSHQIGLVAGATQEDSQYNRARGHGTSVGYLQLINSHGSVAWRMVIENSAGWFLRGARSIDPMGRRSLYHTDRQKGLIQDVQESGHPFAYNQWIPEATRTVALYRASCAPNANR